MNKITSGSSALTVGSAFLAIRQKNNLVKAAERFVCVTEQQMSVSNWLTTLLLKEYGLDLSKQEFRDAIRLTYS